MPYSPFDYTVDSHSDCHSAMPLSATGKTGGKGDGLGCVSVCFRYEDPNMLGSIVVEKVINQLCGCWTLPPPPPPDLLGTESH